MGLPASFVAGVLLAWVVLAGVHLGEADLVVVLQVSSDLVVEELLASFVVEVLQA